MGHIKTCCYCISLTTGGLIIGVLSSIFAIINFFRVLNEILHNDEYFASIHAEEMDKEFTKIILYVLIVSQPIRLAAGIALIVGILKRKSMFLSAWLAVQVLGVFGLIRTVFIFVSSKHTAIEEREYLIEISFGTGKAKAVFTSFNCLFVYLASTLFCFLFHKIFVLRFLLTFHARVAMLFQFDIFCSDYFLVVACHSFTVSIHQAW